MLISFLKLKDIIHFKVNLYLRLRKKTFQFQVPYVLQDPSVNLIGDGHYFIEIEGLAEDSDEDSEFIGLELYSKVPFKKKSKVRFSVKPIKVCHQVLSYLVMLPHNDNASSGKALTDLL